MVREWKTDLHSIVYTRKEKVMQIDETTRLVKLAKKHDKLAFAELMQGHMQEMYKDP